MRFVIDFYVQKTSAEGLEMTLFNFFACHYLIDIYGFNCYCVTNTFVLYSLCRVCVVDHEYERAGLLTGHCAWFTTHGTVYV